MYFFYLDPVLLTACRRPTVITSAEGQIFAALPGRPLNDTTWVETTAGFVAALATAKRKLKFSSKRDRRGYFLTIASGISYGGGQKVRATRFPESYLLTFCRNRATSE